MRCAFFLIFWLGKSEQGAVLVVMLATPSLREIDECFPNVFDHDGFIFAGCIWLSLDSMSESIVAVCDE